jgi:isopentenyl-diphosphate delta-isomerase
MVVLLEADGRAAGQAPKASVHQASTPLHLAFSCYLFDPSDRLLMTRRSSAKRTFPGVWTNSACGHPAPGESAQDAAVRRVRDELGLVIDPPRLVLPAFRYRASMDGIEEHEWCPVLVGRVPADAGLAVDPTEVDEVRWTPWADLVALVAADPGAVSPWCAAQVGALQARGAVPDAWPDGDPGELPGALTCVS